MSNKPISKISQYSVGKKELQAILGPLEASVLETIWNFKRPVTVREVYEKLKKKKKIAYTTVMTVMDRLYNKGLLDRKIEKGRGGLLYVYWSKFEPQNFKKSVVQEVLDSLMENFGDMVISCLIERVATDKQKLEVLREKLENVAKEREGKQQ